MPQERRTVLSLFTRAVVCLALLIGAIGVFVVLRMTKPEPARTDEAPPLRRVEVMSAMTVPVRRQWQGFGTALARDEADVPAEISAVVIEVPTQIVVGAEVQHGAVFARLDDTDFLLEQQISSQRIEDLDAQLAQLELEEKSWQRRVELAEEDVQLVEADYQRARDAMARKAARQREVDEVKQRLVAAIRVEVAAREQRDRISPRRSALLARKAVNQALLRLANKNVERCTIRSPLSGFLAAVDVEVGEALAPGQRVAHVVSLRHIEVPLRLPASARPSVAIGDEVVLSSQGSLSQSWTGTVARIAPADDPVTRTMAVYVDLEQDPRDPDHLAPGKFVLGTVTSKTPELRTVVPRRALLEDRVLLVEDNVVRSRPVEVVYHVQSDFPQLGVDAEQWAVLAEALPSGALVVVNAARTLADGLRVVPIVAGGDSATAMSFDAELPR